MRKPRNQLLVKRCPSPGAADGGRAPTSLPIGLEIVHAVHTDIYGDPLANPAARDKLRGLMVGYWEAPGWGLAVARRAWRVSSASW